jgi:hypothetical protein
MYEPKSNFLVYSLLDPRTGDVRYIGKSSIGMKRPREHQIACGRKAKTHNARWLRELWADGERVPLILVLEECDSEAQVLAREIVLIALFREAGFNLTNITNGGDGISGHKMSPETRARMSALWTPERRAKQSEALKARYENPEARAFLGEAISKAKSTPEGRARASAAGARVLADKSNVAKLVASRWAAPGAREKQSETSKKMWEDKAKAERMIAAKKAQWADPEFKRRSVEAMKAGKARKGIL